MSGTSHSSRILIQISSGKTAGSIAPFASYYVCMQQQQQQPARRTLSLLSAKECAKRLARAASQRARDKKYLYMYASRGCGGDTANSRQRAAGGCCPMLLLCCSDDDVRRRRRLCLTLPEIHEYTSQVQGYYVKKRTNCACNLPSVGDGDRFFHARTLHAYMRVLQQCDAFARCKETVYARANKGSGFEISGIEYLKVVLIFSLYLLYHYNVYLIRLAFSPK